jgi:alkanesulfonate monooxygenase
VITRETSADAWAEADRLLVGSHEEVCDRIAEYHELGIDEFIFSGYPHLEEAYRSGRASSPSCADGA